MLKVAGFIIMKKSEFAEEVNSRLRIALQQFVDRVFYPMDNDLTLPEKKRDIVTRMDIDDVIKELTSKSRRIGGKRKRNAKEVNEHGSSQRNSK